MEHSQIILNLLKEKGISRYRVAKDTGISESLFSKWESHPTSEISSRVLTHLSSYLDCSIDFLLGKENIKGEITMEQNSKISFYIVFNTALAHQIERLCHEKHISVAEIIRKCGLNNGFLTYLKNLNEPISYTILDKISKNLEISIEQLLEQTKTIDEKKHKILKLEDLSFFKNSLTPYQMKQFRQLTTDMKIYDKYALLDNIEKYQISTMYIKSVYSDNDSFVNKQSERMVADKKETSIDAISGIDPKKSLE